MVEHIIEQTAQKVKENQNLKNTDYLDAEGLCWCGICGERKENRYKVLGHERILPCLCRCDREKLEAQKEEERKQDFAIKVSNLKSVGLTEPRFREWRFENDNGSTPKLDIARQYVENWKDMQQRNIGYVLMGPVGTGKSFFAGCVANRLMEQGIPVMMTNFSRILNELTKPYADKNEVINIPYFFIFVIANRISCLYQISPGMTVSDKMMYLMTHSDKVLGLVPSTDIIDILIGAGTAVAAKLLMWQKQQDAKKLRKGVEYGSARWGDRDDIKPYMSDNPWMNIPLTATESITMESRPKNPKFARNKNILVIGGSGSGKTRFFVKPSVMQMNCSYVGTDPKGTLIGEVGRLLKRGAPKRDANGKVIKGTDGKPIYQPYVIKVLNTINFSNSLHYNPFAYIKSEKDILKLVTVIMANTKGEGEKENQHQCEHPYSVY